MARSAEAAQFFKHPQDLHPEHLQSLLIVVARNSTTDSAWPISSNPWAKYNDRSRKDCNLQIPQWKIVRASTAAPVYFPPEVIEWDASDASKSFVFVDGGTTAYNCPAFLMAAWSPSRRTGWLAARRGQTAGGVDRHRLEPGHRLERRRSWDEPAGRRAQYAERGDIRHRSIRT
jgi:hypothetical protein